VRESIPPHGDALALPASVQTIPAALAFWAERTPDAPALRAIDGRVWSHRELVDSVAGVANRLAALGVRPDERVALVAPPSVETAIALLGAMTAAGAAPLYAGTAPAELTRDLRRLAPDLVVTSGSAATMVGNIAAELGIATAAVADLLALDACQTARQDALPTRDPDSITVILHTSGTTSLPKRVPRPHRTYVACARASRACTGLTAADVGLLIAGLHSNQGLGNLLASLFSGGSCVVAPGFDPAAFPDWLAAHQPTWFVCSPTHIAHILDAAESEIIVGPASRLRAVRLGAQPLPPGLRERAERSLRATIFDGFGMTEASYITGQGPDPESRREGSVGPPLNSEIRILDADGRDLAAGEIGDVVIRGETLFPGYLDDPAANEAVFLPGGWFRTGDLGYLHEDGCLSLVGRANEQINRGGEKISPAEIDHALLAHPAVAEAAVFAVPHDRLGEDIVAAVVIKPGQSATPRELRVWLLGRLTPHKVPRRIWQIDELPRNANGKVQRGVLTQRWREDRH
jgi:acyl-CoA synthetase (AMP-forming)/AMP-acid ligase II